MKKRIQTGDSGPITDAEKETITSAVTSKVKDAVGSHQSFFDIFRDQDDALGFTHKILPDTADGTIQAGSFDFPEITTTKTVSPGSSFPPVTIVTDRYVLSGEVTVEAVGSDPVDLCRTQRAAREAKRQQIKGLQLRVSSLQQQLQHATPQQKSAIIHLINETNAEITADEAQLPALEAALQECINHHHTHDHIDPTDVVVANG